MCTSTALLLDLLVPAIELVLELRARQDRAGPREQRFEQRELARRQRDRFAVEATSRASPDRARSRRTRDRASRGRRRGARARECARRARSARTASDIVVGAGVEAGDTIGDRIARGQDEHRTRVASPAHRAQHVEPFLRGMPRSSSSRSCTPSASADLGGPAVAAPSRRRTHPGASLAGRTRRSSGHPRQAACASCKTIRVAKCPARGGLAQVLGSKSSAAEFMQ